LTVDIFTFAHNEEVVLPIMVRFYKQRFADCRITVYDNQSTDNTASIAGKLGCKVIEWNTNNIYDDFLLAEIKSNCWKDSTADWVIICDMDEMIDITDHELTNTVATVIQTTMCNVVGLIHGAFHHGYKDKVRMFKRAEISSIRYDVGCHECEINGNIIIQGGFICYHLKWLSFEYVVNRHKKYATRLSKQNLKNKWSYHWNWNIRKHKKEYAWIMKQAVPVAFLHNLLEKS